MILHYSSLLRGGKDEIITVDYNVDLVEGSSDSIEITTQSNGDKIKRTLSRFTDDLVFSYKYLGAFFWNYEHGIFYSKRFKGGVTEISKYHLSENAVQNSKIKHFFETLGERYLPDYDEIRACDKFCEPLSDLIREGKEIVMTDPDELKEFKAFCNRKDVKDGLACTFYKEAKIPEKYKKYNRHLFKGHYHLTANYLEIIDEMIAESIRENEERILLESQKNQLAERYDDFFLDDIRKYIERINGIKYDGHEEHLRILCVLAEYYLKIKNISCNMTPYELFVGNPNLMRMLVTIESSVDEAINEHNKKISSEGILEELVTLADLPDKGNESEVILQFPLYNICLSGSGVEQNSGVSSLKF